MIQKVGENIRQARLEKNLTQAYVARQLELSTHAYGNIERGQADLNMKRLEQIAEVLGKSPEELLKGQAGIYINGDVSNAINGNQNSGNTIGVQEKTLQQLTSALVDLCTLLKDKLG